jgi:hypothetical protein
MKNHVQSKSVKWNILVNFESWEISYVLIFNAFPFFASLYMHETVKLLTQYAWRVGSWHIDKSQSVLLYFRNIFLLGNYAHQKLFCEWYYCNHQCDHRRLCSAYLLTFIETIYKIIHLYFYAFEYTKTLKL